MKLRKSVLVAIALLIALPLLLFSANALPTTKYVIDGNLSDWGITTNDLRQGFYPIENTTAWLPNGPNVTFIVEDNRDPNYGPAPGGYPTGVHIYGRGHTYHKYNEPKIGGQIPPIGGEYYDIEAMYIDEDANYIYVAMVVSTPSKAIGDLALNLDGLKTTGGYGYEYGVLLNTNNNATQFTIYRTPTNKDWTVPEYGVSAPGYINLSNNPTPVGKAIGAYVKYPTLKDWGPYPTYIVELAIPKSAVGMSGKSIGVTSGANVKTVLSKFHISDTGDCGNDIITTDNISVPEFPSILIPIGLAVGFVAILRRRNF